MDVADTGKVIHSPISNIIICLLIKMMALLKHGL